MSLYDPFDPEVLNLTRKELLSVQLRRLKELLEKVYRTNPFYRRLFQGANVKPEDINSLEAFHEKVPFTDKKLMLEDQGENPPFGNRLGVPAEALREVHITSGTTGIGQEMYGLTANDVELGGRGWTIHLYALGLREGDVGFLTYPVGMTAVALNVLASYRQMKIVSLSTAVYDGETKVRFMKTFKPHHIAATASYATRLSILCQDAGIDPKEEFPLKGITIAGESYPLSWVEKMEDFWGCKIHDLYGCTQNGTAAGSTCEYGAWNRGRPGAIHLFEHMTLFEVINPSTGEKAAYGEEGELVITTLLREASPVIRFRMGDRVKLLPYDECPCRVPLDFIEAGSITRYDDMIKIKASNVWPKTVDDIIFSQKEVEEYNARIFVDEQGREKVEVLVEFRKEMHDEAVKKQILKKFAEEIRRKTQVSMELKEVAHGTLERHLFKAKRWTDERKEGLRKVKYTE